MLGTLPSTSPSLAVKFVDVKVTKKSVLKTRLCSLKWVGFRVEPCKSVDKDAFFSTLFLVTFTSTNFTARDGLVDGKVPNTRAQGAMEGFVEKRRVSCQASL